jgi:hypothetical protein
MWLNVTLRIAYIMRPVRRLNETCQPTVYIVKCKQLSVLHFWSGYTNRWYLKRTVMSRNGGWIGWNFIILLWDKFSFVFIYRYWTVMNTFIEFILMGNVLCGSFNTLESFYEFSYRHSVKQVLRDLAPCLHCTIKYAISSRFYTVQWNWDNSNPKEPAKKFEL